MFSSLIRLIALTAAALASGLLTDARAFPLPDIRTVREFYNGYTRHYLLLSNPAEIAAVEAGSAGPGWVPTGYMFEPNSGGNVCRFYAPAPTNSHFYTANAEECAFLRNNNTGWIFEGNEFAIRPPEGGACVPGLIPIYRLYNNRARFQDANHRFVHDAEARDAMLAAGWVDEGVAFCTANASRAGRMSFKIATEQVRPSSECEDEAINLGPCVATNQLPRFTNRVASWLPPFWVTKDPAYSERYTQITGFDGNVFTAQAPNDPDAVALHSFAQTLHIGDQLFGIHVNHIDRTVGFLASINPLYQFGTTPPPAGATDKRLLPWLYPNENQIEVSFDLSIRTIRLLNPESLAGGHPTLQFMDMTNGQHFYVTLGTFGTGTAGKPPADLVAIDSGTGRVIVGTAIGPNPLFGKRIAGEFLPCEANAAQGSCANGGKGHFAFRISRADFVKVLGHARTLNPRLSDVPANYLLANFHFNNEIYREAELGLTLSSYELKVYGY